MPQPSAKVRYLSQSFVKSLCSFDQHERLVEQIENILFQYVPATDTLGAKKFVELKSKKAEGIQLEISKLASKLQAFNKEIVDLETEIASKDDLVSEKEELEVEREELLKQRPKPVSAQEEADEKALSDLKKKKDDFETQISDRRIKISKLELLQTKAALVLNEIQSFNDEAKAVFAEIGEPSGSETVSIPVPVHIETALAAKITELSNEVSAIEGSEEADGEKEALKSVEAKIQEIEERREIEMERKTKLQEFDLRIAAIDQRLKTLTSSIQLIESKKQGELDTKVKERDAEFLRFFTLLERKKQILQALYEPLSKTAGGNGERGKVEFSAEYSFNHKRFASDGLVVFDRRKSAIRDEQELRECGKRYWDKMKGTLHAPSLQPLLDLEREMEPNAEERPIAAQLRGEYGILDFYHWLYSVEYYDVEYGIKYEGTDLQKLSPGRKGVVLLLIYLDIDKDYRPLIIDQPEENLDNRSVYSTLVEYFRKAKKKRQIIIVTHNANLVVNGDAEQVIVANFEVEPTTQPTKIKYVCGSLENSRATDRNVPNILERQGIREHVCEVLEGGDVAFKKREDKYGFA
jgi:DNA repair exonuclease SbcCD ATPase subunit